MHYYKKNIGDYHKKAGRLTMLQHGAYTLLMDACYDREKFPTKEEAIDWLWASNPDEIAAIEFVLNKFFTLDGDVYIQARIQLELDKYQENALTNKRIAIEREAKRRNKSTKRARSVNEPPPNQEPLTINQEPLTKKHKPNGKNKTSIPDGFSISDNVKQWAINKGFTNLDSHLENFIISCKKKDYKYVDWDSAFMGAIRSDWAKINNTQVSQPRRSFPK